MKIYFEDGELVQSGYFANYNRINAKYGVSANMVRLDVLRKTEPDAIVYTNSILAFSNEYAWNEELKVPEIYIRAGEHMIFTRIDKLTTRDKKKLSKFTSRPTASLREIAISLISLAIGLFMFMPIPTIE